MTRRPLYAVCVFLAMASGANPVTAQPGGDVVPGLAAVPYTPPPAPVAGASADPDFQEALTGAGARIGRISLVAGECWWYVDAMGQAGWLPAEPNLPLASRSSLSTGREGRAEVRIGSTTVGLDSESQADFIELSDTVLRLRVVRGAVSITIASTRPEAIELLAGTARLRISESGTYVLADDRISGRVIAKARQGRATLSIGSDSAPVTSGMQAVIEAGANRIAWHGSMDTGAFEQWADARAAQWQVTDDSAHVSAELTGADVLDANGRWENDQTHGRIWYPAGVDSAWEPYRDGRWTQVQPWGVVWIAAAPWGFATSWYGRWQRTDQRWGWIPGPRSNRPVFHPPAAFAPSPPASPVGAARWPAPGRAFAPIGQPPPPVALPPRFVAPQTGVTAQPPRNFPQPSRDFPVPPRDFPTPSRDWPSAASGLAPPAARQPGPLPGARSMVIKPQGDPSGGWKRTTQ